jgi:formylglycine-generating enzyme required for sulfatase activity
VNLFWNANPNLVWQVAIKRSRLGESTHSSIDTPTYPLGEVDPNCTLMNSYNIIAGSYCGGDAFPVGSYPAGDSTYCVLDMVGKVGELVNDWWRAIYYCVPPPNNPLGLVNGFS